MLNRLIIAEESNIQLLSVFFAKSWLGYKATPVQHHLSLAFHQLCLTKSWPISSPTDQSDLNLWLFSSKGRKRKANEWWPASFPLYPTQTTITVREMPTDGQSVTVIRLAAIPQPSYFWLELEHIGGENPAAACYHSTSFGSPKP